MSIKIRQEKFCKDFNILNDWTEKYSYLISLGKLLDTYPEKKMTRLYLIEGCQSRVWFFSQITNGKVVFSGTSDALIVSGLIYILLQVYNNSTAMEILNSNANFIDKIGFSKYLSVIRQNGLSSMLNFIHRVASKYA